MNDLQKIESKPLKIVVVGAGAAGYFIAAGLARNCPNVDVTIVHDPNTPYIGVGESTGFGCRWDLYHLFGVLDDLDWMKKTN